MFFFFAILYYKSTLLSLVRNQTFCIGSRKVTSRIFLSPTIVSAVLSKSLFIHSTAKEGEGFFFHNFTVVIVCLISRSRDEKSEGLSCYLPKATFIIVVKILYIDTVQ